ncbi:MAG: aromatic amino acid lyase, partial [Thermoplasmatota archaeon]
PAAAGGRAVSRTASLVAIAALAAATAASLAAPVWAAAVLAVAAVAALRSGRRAFLLLAAANLAVNTALMAVSPRTGEILAFHLDFLAIALAEVANIAERRVERLVNPDLSEGLKPFLVDSGGLNSGFMIAQYVAAALVSENKVHAHPASVDSIPTSANQEDHVSMGSVSALKLARVLENARTVVAIEALCAAQALDFKAPLRPGTGSAAAHKAVRRAVPKLDKDRILADDVATALRLLKAGALRAAVAKAGVRLA